MVKHYTNITKTNNHISLSFTEHKKKPTAYDVGNPGPDLGQVHECGGAKPVKRIQNLDNQFTKCMFISSCL
jgi:hypothetical protein